VGEECEEWSCEAQSGNHRNWHIWGSGGGQKKAFDKVTHNVSKGLNNLRKESCQVEKSQREILREFNHQTEKHVGFEVRKRTAVKTWGEGQSSRGLDQKRIIRVEMVWGNWYRKQLIHKQS